MQRLPPQRLRRNVGTTDSCENPEIALAALQPHMREVTASSDDACSICLSKMGPGDKLLGLRCAHTFHDQCIKAWIIRSGYDACCPLCKSSVAGAVAPPPSPPLTPPAAASAEDAVQPFPSSTSIDSAAGPSGVAAGGARDDAAGGMVVVVDIGMDTDEQETEAAPAGAPAQALRREDSPSMTKALAC